MAKNDDTCYKFPNCKDCTDKNCSIYNCIHTDNKETLHNALKRIEDLEKEKCELLGIIQGKDTAIQDLQKEKQKLKILISSILYEINALWNIDEMNEDVRKHAERIDWELENE